MEAEQQACIEIENHATLFFMINVALSMDPGRSRRNTKDDDNMTT